MGRHKLEKFKDLDTFKCVYQFPLSEFRCGRGVSPIQWQDDYFHNSNPIVVELGCGYGEYTVQMAQSFPYCNFIGVDIKGSRLWHGAKYVEENNLANVCFIRTQVELLANLFYPASVSQIWLTFPDPQMKKYTKRLVSSSFFSLYSNFLVPSGDIFLKTDSRFLYLYTKALLSINHIGLKEDFEDLYAVSSVPDWSAVRSIKTKYERQWLERGLSIKYLHWQLPHVQTFVEPEIEIEHDSYKSYGRGYITTGEEY